MNPPSNRRWSWSSIWPWLGFLFAWWLLVGPMICGDVVPAFRDSGLLYFPLFRWIDAQWAAGQVPLWNPHCNFGISVVGDNTSSVFYPGKLIFFMRFLSYPSRYGIYLASHILLAAAGSYWLARVLKANRCGAMLAAISYAFGGTVLFQVTNVIYLVSAAWLPMALGCIWFMIRTSQWRYAIAGGTVCAMIILGGDPQMVYHIGLIALTTGLRRSWLNHRRRKRWKRIPGVESLQTRRPQAFGFALNLGMMILVATVLSLIQLIPTWQWSQLSERHQSQIAANIYQAAGKDLRMAGKELLGPPPPGTMVHHAYQFSQPPWTLAEFLWPNVSGKIFPTHQRWTDVFPGADRVWNPSLYLGILTIWLAITGMQFVGGGRRTWLTRIGLFFLFASFGWYGVGWLINETLPMEWQMESVGPQVGGLYWMMMIGLPKYYSFRYPAKLMVIATLCLCVLAGVNLRRWRLNFSSTWVGFYALLTSLGAIGLLLGLDAKIFDRVPADGLFGPFDIHAAKFNLLFGCGQSVTLLLGITVASRYLFPTNGPARTGWNASGNRMLWMIVGLTAIDLLVANRWLLSDIATTAFEKNTPQLKRLDNELANWSETQNGGGFPTLYRPRDAFLPQQWKQTISEDRLTELILWQRETCYPKQHLNRPIRLLGSFSSIWPQRYEELLSNLETENVAVDEYADGVLAEENRAGLRPVGINWFPHHRQPVFLVDEKGAPAHGPPTDGHEHSTCEVQRFENQAITASVTLSSSRWVVLDTLYDGNWKVEIHHRKSNRKETLPTTELAGCTQGILLDVGTYDLRFFYSPSGFWIGAWSSGIAWLLLVVWWVGLLKSST